MAELLTVLAILFVLAGLLFPVLNSVKSAARRSQCLSNMHQAQLASELYMMDYDDMFMPVNHRPGMAPNARLDRTWVQLVLPYAKSFGIFSCPSVYGIRQEPETSFDSDLVPGDIYAQYYSASMHVTMGYNYLYLSPIFRRHNVWESEPKSGTDVSDPSKTLLFVDSIWDRTVDGTPMGGGNWLVVPPCRYEGMAGQLIDTFVAQGAVYTPSYGWKVDSPNSPHIYGNAWPWHSGRVNFARVDGSASSVTVGELTAGCNLGDSWNGTIRDADAYMWDTQ